MAKRLTDNVNSSYIEAANRLKPKRKGRRVVAYVESYDDVLFWRSVLEEFERPDLHFEVMLPSRTSLAKGKKLAMAQVIEAHAATSAEAHAAASAGAHAAGTTATPHSALGPCMIACVDADYDYLMQRHTDNSRRMLDNPYIFHTYVYAIENYQCYAPGLHSACVMATLNDRELIDLEEFMRQYSLIIWPLLLWSVWMYRHDHYKDFSIMHMAAEVSFRDVNTYHPEQTLDYVRRHVNKAVAWMQQNHPEAKKSFAALRDELLALGLTPETSYLYIQGHTLFDNVILPLLGPICTQLRRERENEITRLACHDTQRQNELSCYQHSVQGIDVMLKKSTHFKHSAPYQRMCQDIQQFVQRIVE